jgi:hypothetical protein
VPALQSAPVSKSAGKTPARKETNTPTKEAPTSKKATKKKPPAHKGLDLGDTEDNGKDKRKSPRAPKPTTPGEAHN